MPKSWFISKATRSSFCMQLCLSILRDMQGRTWDREAQIEFQIRLLQESVLGVDEYQFYEGLSKEEFYSIAGQDNISFAHARSLFERRNLKNPSVRAHALFNPLQRLGFAALRDNAVYVTDMGKMLLDAGDEHNEILLRALLKWQFPNPLEKSAISSQDCQIKPFVGVLRLIEAVNRTCEDDGKEAKGISFREFRLFALNLDNWKRIYSTAEKIVRIRRKVAKASATKRYLILEVEAKKAIKNFNLHSMRDFHDILGIFRMTNFFSLRDCETHIDLDPTRKVELSSLFKRDNAAPLHEFAVWDKKNKKEVLEKYLDYIGSVKTPALPRQTRTELLASIRLVHAEIENLGGAPRLPM